MTWAPATWQDLPLYPYKGIYRDLESAKVLLSEIPSFLNTSVETPGVRRKAGVEDRVMTVYGKRYRMILEEAFQAILRPY